ncbi:MAG: ABC transporter ATP-binding protein [Pseudomonadota bacterium]
MHLLLPADVPTGDGPSAAPSPALSVAPEGAPLVQMRQVCKRHVERGVGVQALTNISLHIERGEFTCLVGPSGSGKTTLLNLIGALDKPDSGDVLLEGESVVRVSGTQLSEVRLRKIGFIFQQHHLLPVLSALENVEYVLLLQGVAPARRRERALAALHQLGLQGSEHCRPHQLSGGQQQRVAVARAIAGNPVLVLADEPTAHLDAVAGAALLDILRQLNREHRTTFVFSTHDERMVQHASRTIELCEGRIVRDRVHAFL